MTNYQYAVVYSTKFKKSLKKILKQGKSIDDLKEVIDKLVIKEDLNQKYKNHKLIDDKYYKNCYECHIKPDWLLIYQYDEKGNLLLLMNTGSHSDLFN